MASCGRQLNIWSKRWGNTDATGTSSGYQNISGDQLRLTTGQAYTYYDCPGSTINFTTTVANGVYLLRADLQTYAGGSGGGNGWNFGFKFKFKSLQGFWKKRLDKYSTWSLFIIIFFNNFID